VNPLQRRLAALRRRVRFVAAVRGACWVAALVLGLACLAGALDWLVHLPALVRAVLLVALLAAGGYVGYVHFVAPLAAPVDDLSLALQVENYYPALDDALASAVQFLEGSSSEEDGVSPSLRRAAIDRALGQAQGLDFSNLVDKRGLRSGQFCLLAAGCLAAVFVLAHPERARIGLVRLLHPFGGLDWPTQTRLEVTFQSRAARGEPYLIHGMVRGFIPERILIEARFPDRLPVIQSYEITRDARTGEGRFQARLEPGAEQPQFRFQVRAHDAATPWYDVQLLPPPQLVLLDGRPSPQFHLEFPAYTDLPPRDLPDLVSLLETVGGTRIRVRAAVDRPLARAWLEYPDELDPLCRATASLSVPSSCAGFAGPLAGIGQLVAAREQSWKRIPAQLDDEGREFSLELQARVSGTFALHLEDELGIGNTRLIELRTLSDPPPEVHLERPARGQDVLDVLPDAEITLEVHVQDPVFAVRSAELKFRAHGEGKNPAAGERLPLYGHAAWEETLAALVGGLRTGPWGVPLPLRLRASQLDIRRRWSLANLHLQEGDVVTLQAAADDFDDVTVLKPPGQSQEVELHIIGRTALDILINEAQAAIQQELVRLHRLQSEALDKVKPAVKQWREQGKLLPKQVEELLQAEQLQQQIRGRVGDTREGLRADVGRVIEALRDNHLPRSSVHDRMDSLAGELDRMQREDLEQIEPRLTEARKESELGSKRSAEERARGPLADAHKRQQDAEKTLRELLQLLEPWSSTQQAHGEARSILQEQRNLNQQLNRFADKAQRTRPEEWSEEQRSEKDQLAEQQNRLVERTSQLLDRLSRLAQEKSAQDPQKAQTLAEAARRGEDSNVAGKMHEAEQHLQKNQLNEAGRQQQQAARAMEDVVGALEERREDELDRLVKKLRDAEDKLADLAERQDRLQKKAREASGIRDARQRAEALKRLAREQEELQQQAQDMVRELSRLRAQSASQAMSEAGSRMQRAGQQMNQGEDSAEQQDEALDRLDEAQRGLQQERQQAEEELTRERVARITDQIKGLKTRQDALVAEAQRLHRAVLQQKHWTRPYQQSLVELGEHQKDLGNETEQAAREKLEGAKVFEHLLISSAEAMKQASERIEDRKQAILGRKEASGDEQPGTLDLKAEEEAQSGILRLQNLALRRIDQLVDALKPESGPSQQARGSGRGGGVGGGASARSGSEPRLPPLAQLKALHALQQEVFERTRDFGKQHPDTAKLNRAEQAELQALQREQEEIAQLFEAISAPPYEKE
jgi:hypothetical protein